MDEILDLLSRFSAREEDHSVLLELRNTCSKPFERDAGGEQLLLEICNAAFPAEPRDHMSKGDHWKRLGFQSTDPFTDIRAGQLGPLQLHYFASKHPTQLQQFAKEAIVSGYPFACSCFNISQIIALFFNLYETPAMNPVSGAKTASRIQLNNFARLCNVSPGSAQTVLDELFCTLVRHLHETWKRMHATGECSIMEFSSALREVYDNNAAFWKCGHGDLADLNDLSVGHSHGTGRGASWLQTLLAVSIKDILHTMDTYILKAVAVFERIMAGQKTKMLACPVTATRTESTCYGTYVPPVPQVEATSVQRSWLAKPIDGVNLDSFFESSDKSDNAEARNISTSPTGLQTSGAEDSTRYSIASHSEILPEDVKSAPVAPIRVESQSPDVNSASIVRPIDAMDLDAFFRDWGLSDNTQARTEQLQNAQQGVDHHRLKLCSSANGLDTFLETCLAVS